jgi:hypothetical protein
VRCYSDCLPSRTAVSDNSATFFYVELRQDRESYNPDGAVYAGLSARKKRGCIATRPERGAVITKTPMPRVNLPTELS